MNTGTINRIRKTLGDALIVGVMISLCLGAAGGPGLHARAEQAGLWYVAPGGNDSASCAEPSAPCATIQAAIGKAASGDKVYVAVGTYTGNTGEAVVTISNKDLVLSGGWDSAFASQEGMSVIDGQGARRGITTEAAVTLEKFTIQNGYASMRGGGIHNTGIGTSLKACLIQNNVSDWMGGGIFNSGSMTVNDTVIRGNAAGNPEASGGGGGGGIENDGTLTLNNSSVSGNTIRGGFVASGIHDNASLTLNNSTVSANAGAEEAIYSFVGTLELNSSTVANNRGKGIVNINGTVRLRNTLVANNSLDLINDPNYPSGTVTSLGYNLIGTSQNFTPGSSDLTGIDPQLDPVQDNGGSTLTQALQQGSPAINAGDPAGCQGSAGLLTTDQRGFPRADRCDIGAYEVQALDFSSLTVSPTTAPAGSAVTYTFKVVNGGPSALDYVTVTDTLPATLAALPRTLTASSGVVTYADGTITWTGRVNPLSQVTITFQAEVGQAAMGSVVTNEAVFRSEAETFPRTASFRVPPPYLAFMPLVIQPAPGLYGRITLNGEPVGYEPVELRFYNGSSWSTLNILNTDADGNIYFWGVPALGSGQAYYLRWINSQNHPGQLSEWHTRSISSYDPKQAVYMGAFDLADVSLVFPEPGAKINLPRTFTWTKRPVTPSDSYQFELFDPSGPADFFSAELGYIDSYTLNGLPGGFVINKFYGWSIWVNGPDGGYGLAFYYRTVLFKNSGLSQVLPAPEARQGKPDEDVFQCSGAMCGIGRWTMDNGRWGWQVFMGVF